MRSTLFDRGFAADLSDGVQVFTWCIHVWYTRVLSSQMGGSLRGTWPALAAWFLSLLVAAAQCRGDILRSHSLANPQA